LQHTQEFRGNQPRGLLLEPVANSFARVVTGDSHLGYLDLSSNQIDDNGVIALARAFERNQTLVELHVAAKWSTAVGGSAAYKRDPDRPEYLS
jgi:hypothetical protein